MKLQLLECCGKAGGKRFDIRLRVRRFSCVLGRPFEPVQRNKQGVSGFGGGVLGVRGHDRSPCCWLWREELTASSGTRWLTRPRLVSFLQFCIYNNSVRRQPSQRERCYESELKVQLAPLKSQAYREHNTRNSSARLSNRQA